MTSDIMLRRFYALPLLFSLFSAQSYGHDHGHMDDDSPQILNPHNFESDGWLNTHIFLMVIAFAFIFPFGAILGLRKSKWHVPMQIAGMCVTALGYVAGHSHSIPFPQHTPHSIGANILLLLLASQAAVGSYLKFFKSKHARNIQLRKTLRKAHSFIGRSWFVLPFIQMLFGYIALSKMCYAVTDSLGNCVAHYIMGSAFVAYGVVNLSRFFGFLQTARPTEFFDSFVILAWGIVNTFTEHRWGEEWNHKDLQHTSDGILWWAGGIVCILLSVWKPVAIPGVNIFPAMIIFFTGVSMLTHAQHKAISILTHQFFGYSLVITSLLRMSAILTRGKDIDDHRDAPRQNIELITSFFFILSGILFAGSNDDMLTWVSALGIDGTTYATLLVSWAFCVFAYVLVGIGLFRSSRKSVEWKKVNTLVENNRDDETVVFELEEVEMSDVTNEREGEGGGERERQRLPELDVVELGAM